VAEGTAVDCLFKSTQRKYSALSEMELTFGVMDNCRPARNWFHQPGVLAYDAPRVI